MDSSHPVPNRLIDYEPLQLFWFEGHVILYNKLYHRLDSMQTMFHSKHNIFFFFFFFGNKKFLQSKKRNFAYLYILMTVSNQFSTVGRSWIFFFRYCGASLTALKMHWPLNLYALLSSRVVMTEGYSKCYLKISHNQNIKLSFHNRHLRGAFLGKENIAQNSVTFVQ